jgi:hypothetical protein
MTEKTEMPHKIKLVVIEDIISSLMALGIIDDRTSSSFIIEQLEVVEVIKVIEPEGEAKCQ